MIAMGQPRRIEFESGYGDETLVFERKLSIFYFPAEQLRKGMSVLPLPELRVKTNEPLLGDGHAHEFAIYIHPGPRFDERAAERGIDRWIAAIADTEQRRQREEQAQRELVDRLNDTLRRARLGGGNAHDRRKRRRAMLRAFREQERTRR